ncbi:hypothetical protein E2C01_067986 [Portunus trituberculatus]|uniref:Uncharacterized protein n=1 Tax=Portunus trituberculatus TaxID=210409 RepID=A0A5B7HMJ7_PORTR|nr:hypothetical protein [Portunus trituberculatus]
MTPSCKDHHPTHGRRRPAHCPDTLPLVLERRSAVPPCAAVVLWCCAALTKRYKYTLPLTLCHFLLAIAATTRRKRKKRSGKREDNEGRMLLLVTEEEDEKEDK